MGAQTRRIRQPRAALISLSGSRITRQDTRVVVRRGAHMRRSWQPRAAFIFFGTLPDREHCVGADRRGGSGTMTRWIVGSSLRSRLLIVPVAAALLLVGFIQLRSMPVDVLPEFTPPLVEIQAEALGLSAAEVEQLVTVPLEQDLLNGVAWLDQNHSEPLPGLSRIEMIFEPGTDVLKARQLVQERLIQAPGGTPNVSKAPIVLQPLSSTSRVMTVGFSSK